MNGHLVQPSRRGFLGALGVSFFTTPGLFAENLFPTPMLTEGPFYPDKLPLDTDNDLIIVNNSLTPAIGAITHLTGRVLGPTGTAIKDAVVEIWQCDANEVYLHTSDSIPRIGNAIRTSRGSGSSRPMRRENIASVPSNRFPIPVGRPHTSTSK